MWRRFIDWFLKRSSKRYSLDCCPTPDHVMDCEERACQSCGAYWWGDIHKDFWVRQTPSNLGFGRVALAARERAAK